MDRGSCWSSSSHRCPLTVEHQHIGDGEGRNTARVSVAVQELDLQAIGRQLLHNSPHVTDLHLSVRRRVQYRDHNQKFGRTRSAHITPPVSQYITSHQLPRQDVRICESRSSWFIRQRLGDGIASGLND